jgi:RNA polymerase sigma-70 factor (ECF subfamily)
MNAIDENSKIAAIVVRVLEGDTTAQSELIQATQDRLYKFCILISHNREVAEDLCQETFIKALQNIKNLKNPKTFLGWMYQIAKNILIDIKRKPSSKEQSEEGALETGTTLDLDLMINVQKILAQFDPEERLLLLLIELEGYSYKETGEVVGLSEDAVRSKLHRLRQIFIKDFNASKKS